MSASNDCKSLKTPVIKPAFVHCNTDTVLNARAYILYTGIIFIMHDVDDRSNIPQINDVMGMKILKYKVQRSTLHPAWTTFSMMRSVKTASCFQTC